mgnify:CR=1 FL=1
MKRYRRSSLLNDQSGVIRETNRIGDYLGVQLNYLGVLTTKEELEISPGVGDCWIRFEGADLTEEERTDGRKIPIPQFRIRFGDPQQAGTLFVVSGSIV